MDEKIDRRSCLGILASLPVIGAGVMLAAKPSRKHWYTLRVVSERELPQMLSDGWTIRGRNKDGDYSIERYNGMIDASKLGFSDKT